jgi:hypothetical protein
MHVVWPKSATEASAVETKANDGTAGGFRATRFWGYLHKVNNNLEDNIIAAGVLCR